MHQCPATHADGLDLPWLISGPTDLGPTWYQHEPELFKWTFSPYKCTGRYKVQITNGENADWKCTTFYFTRDPTDPILDTGFLIVPHHRANRGVEGMSHNRSQNNEISCSSM